MNKIKAIDTYYNGHLFRSRLEARWAVFFDTLGVTYEYEPEGFELDGFEADQKVRYLPDFWLPMQRCWVEIKPPGEWGYHPECDLLAQQTDCRFVIYITGNPWPGEYGIAVYPVNSGFLDTEHPMVFALGRKYDDELWVSHVDVGATCLNSAVPADDRWPLEDAPQLITAYRAARQARFEFQDRRRPGKRQKI